ncbi:MAG: cellulose biosynthesis cyclic di-GMP-binding regulatory protein BcsB [Christensenellales bacterium]
MKTPNMNLTRRLALCLLVVMLCRPTLLIPSGLAQDGIPVDPTVAPHVDASSAMSETPAEMAGEDPLDSKLVLTPNPDGRPSLADEFGSLEASSFDFDLPAPRTMKGIFSTLGMYISLPDYVIAREAVFRVSYTCSDLILAARSSLTFLVNGAPVYSCPIVYSPTGQTLIYVSLPIDLFTEDYNLVQINGYARLTEGEGCSDQSADGNWVQFHEQSTLRVSFEIVDGANYLGLYPYPFLWLADPQGKQLSIAVSDTMDDQEVSAALYTMADLGGVVKDDNRILLTTWENADRERCIYFGLKTNTPESLLALLEPASIPSSGALIKRVRAGGRDILLVISETGDALMEAARLLADDLRVMQLYEPFTTVLLGEAEQAAARSTLRETAVSSAYTLKDILGRGIMLTGPFHQESTIFLPVPSDYLLSGQSRFDLLLRYSENLDFDRSMMTVYWGDVPLASRKLTREGVNGDTFTIVPPVDLIDSPGTYLRIAFELEIKDLECTPRQTHMPWAYVAETSLIYLPEGRRGTYSLSSRPSPFQKNGSLDHVLVVVPDAFGQAELSLAGAVLSRYGAATNAYGQLRVVRESGFSPDMVDANIIAIGLRNSAFMAAIDEHMYIRYNDNLSSYLSNEKVTLASDFARNIGLVQLIDSPFAERRAILAVSAASAEGLPRVERLFSEQKMSWKLEKDAVIIDEQSKVTSYAMRSDLPNQLDQLSWLDKMAKNKGDIIFSLIGIGVMLLLLLTIILLLIRLKERNSKSPGK